MREPEEKLIKLPERFWALKNHVGIFVVILQLPSCQRQCGYCWRREGVCMCACACACVERYAKEVAESSG